MSIDFTIKGSQDLMGVLRETDKRLVRGARNGVEEILDDWRVEAMDIAPYRTGTLHDSIHAEPVANALKIGDVSGTISANAVKDGFNYAYYIHEESKRAVSGDPEFLETPTKESAARWQTIFDEAVKREVGKWWE